jgi:hypothetical protein
LGKNLDDVTAEDIRRVSPTIAYIDPVANQPLADAETLGIAPWGAFPRAVDCV